MSDEFNWRGSDLSLSIKLRPYQPGAWSLNSPLPLPTLLPLTPLPRHRHIHHLPIPRPLRHQDLLRPIPRQIDIRPGRPHFQEHKQQIVDHDTHTEQLPGPDAAAIVPLQAVDQRETLHARSAARGGPAAAEGVVAVELLGAERAGDTVVDALGALRDVGPGVHAPDLVVEALGADAVGAESGDGLGGGGDEVVLLGLGEGRHVLWQHLGDAADARADDVEAAAGGFDDDGAEGLGQARVQVDVAAHHDVADFFVADGAEKLDTVLEDAPFEHLFEVDGFGAGAGDDEADVRVVGEDAGDGGDKEVGAFVVEEARDDYYGDCVVGAEVLGWRGQWASGSG